LQSRSLAKAVSAGFIILAFSRQATIFCIQNENDFHYLTLKIEKKAQSSFQVNIILNRGTGFMYGLDFHSLHASKIPMSEKIHIIYMGLWLGPQNGGIS
jgi:hypothetical protein